MPSTPVTPIREGTSIFVSIYAVVLMWGLLRLVQGQGGIQRLAGIPAEPHCHPVPRHRPGSLPVPRQDLVRTGPKAMRIFRGEDLVPEKPIVIARYVALAAVSLLVLIIVA